MAARAALALACALLSACGGGDDELVVSAAASLKVPFTAYGRAFDGATVRLSFGGSDELAAQIRRGARPDVFASANAALPAALHAEGLVERPLSFATNALVLAVPRGGRVHALGDLAHPGVQVAIAARGVPAGDYARALLRRLGRERSARILANVRSEEPDVNGIVGKLTQGAADAGFVYRTDVLATGGRLRAIAIPQAEPVRYAAAVVKGAGDPERARAFVAGLRRGEGAGELRRAGFGAAP